MGNYSSERVQQRIYTHIVPCETFARSVSIPPRVSGLLFDWLIQLRDNGLVYRAQEHPELARQFPGAWGCFIFETNVKLPDEVKWRLMDVLDIHLGVFNWLQ